MDDAGIQRRLDVIIALQLLLLALVLPGGGPAIALLVGALIAFYAIFFGVSILERRPGEG